MNETKVKVVKDNPGIPCYGVSLTAEQAKLVQYKEMKIYEVNGQTLFSVKDSNGNPTGEWVFYVLFV